MTSNSERGNVLYGATKGLIEAIGGPAKVDDKELQRKVFAYLHNIAAVLEHLPLRDVEKSEDALCTCGAGHGSLEGHLAWCAWAETQQKPARKTMWAKVIVDEFDGQIMWECVTEGDPEGPEINGKVTLVATQFPIGTRLEIYEPEVQS